MARGLADQHPLLDGGQERAEDRLGAAAGGGWSERDAQLHPQLSNPWLADADEDDPDEAGKRPSECFRVLHADGAAELRDLPLLPRLRPVPGHLPRQAHAKEQQRACPWPRCRRRGELLRRPRAPGRAPGDPPGGCRRPRHGVRGESCRWHAHLAQPGGPRPEAVQRGRLLVSRRNSHGTRPRESRSVRGSHDHRLQVWPGGVPDLAG
mmetsp:Transcript_100540/g.239765  ORF Transcript_100540/g.239765 Transcript_100540/m.239765 type:complete len:208 (+) Transcript_100540:343-966(+)